MRRSVVFNRNGFKRARHCGRWSDESQLLTQFSWEDGTLLLNTSTAQLQRLQQINQVCMYPAIRKWETALPCHLPKYIWTETWVPGRAAKENVFLWLILFRAFATLSWCFPNRPSTDPAVWWPRCHQGLKEDSLHCIWQCNSSQTSWRWCNNILASVACSSAQVQIEPQQVIMAIALPTECEVPVKLWSMARALICWRIWLARNNCVSKANY